MPFDQTAAAQAELLLQKSKKLLIVPHANVDPDGLSSALACSLHFTRLGKKCTVLCPDTLPASLSFLPGYDHLETELSLERECIIRVQPKEGVIIEQVKHAIEDDGTVTIIVTSQHGTITQEQVQVQDGALPYDLIVAVDTAEPHLFGSFFVNHQQLFEDIPILNIDHHISNSRYGQVNLINADAASATEVLYEWWSAHPQWNGMIDADIATLFLAGIITDTRSFQNPNTTPQSLEVAANLIDLGARQQEIIKQVYKTKPLTTLKIWGRALNRIQANPAQRIVWSSISREDLEEMQSSSKETHGIIDELLTTVPDMDVYILFTEMEEGGLKASVRTSDMIDASAIAAALFGGGGHARAAGFRVKQYDNFQLAVLDCVQKFAIAVQQQRSGQALSQSATSAQRPSAQNDGIDVVHTLASE